MSEVREIIKDFLAVQRSDYLEKKVLQETRERKKKIDSLREKSADNSNDEKLVLEQAKYDQAVEKARDKFQIEAHDKYDLLKWLTDAYNKAKPNVTTHPAKFTNPKISDVTSFLFYGQRIDDGYLKMGNVNLTSKVDVSGNSATNTIIFELYSLLSKQKINGDSLVELFEIDDDELVDFFKTTHIPYQEMKAKCLDVFYGKNSDQATHEQIKQVYFPVSTEDEYHLLSLVTPAMLMFECKNRIDAFDLWVDGNHIRKLRKDSKFYADGYDEIPNLTEIGFSHTEFTKMGNVSYLNVKNKGISYLLSSAPPKLTQRQIRLPSQSFFKNSLRVRTFQDEFQALDKLIKTGINNIHVRDGIKNCLRYIIDHALQQAFKVRAYPSGWSNTEYYQSLPVAQRIWLDDAHLEQRENQDDWLEVVVADFGRWILASYEYQFKDTYTKLGDDELRAIKDIVYQAVSNDQEFFK